MIIICTIHQGHSTTIYTSYIYTNRHFSKTITDNERNYYDSHVLYCSRKTIAHNRNSTIYHTYWYCFPLWSQIDYYHFNLSIQKLYTFTYTLCYYLLIKVYSSLAVVTANWSGRRVKLTIQSHQLCCLGNTWPLICTLGTRLGPWARLLNVGWSGGGPMGGEGGEGGGWECEPVGGRGGAGEENTGCIPSFSLSASCMAASRFQWCVERIWTLLSWSSMPAMPCACTCAYLCQHTFKPYIYIYIWDINQSVDYWSKKLVKDTSDVYRINLCIVFHP